MLIVQMNQPRTRWIVGCMTGTSLDAVDVVLAKVTGSGLEMTAQPIGHLDQSLGPLADRLRALASGTPAPPIDVLRAARALGELHAEAVARLLEQCEHGPIDLVAAHGQTIWHAPDENLSWQLFDPWPIVRRLKVPVVCDLRQSDLIAGGQGAPITPLADWILYRHATRERLVVNLGGICNVTHLPAGGSPDQVRGGDVGPCNLLIDGLVRLLFAGQPFDRDGKLAGQGTPHAELYDRVRQAPFFARPAPRSTGREDFSDDWVRSLATGWTADPHDLVASAVDAVARLIANAAEDCHAADLILAGGGAHNPLLVQAIRQHAPERNVVLSDDLGIPVQAREALAFAALAALSQDGIPITLPAITGATEPTRAGTWVYP